jgi:hypothetical protein
MARDSQPMHEPVVAWLRSFGDPLRNTKSAAQWIASLPTTDAMAIQKEALELVSKFPGSRRVAGPAQAEALLRIDARLEPVLTQLATQYTTNYQKSTAVETRLWHGVFDLVKAFASAYSGTLRAGYPRADQKRWRDLLPWILLRLVHYKGTDGKFRLFRYSHGSRRNGANSTSSTNSPGCATGSAKSSRTAPACSRKRPRRSSRNT